MRFFRKGFTLMEVNLAVFIMAVGVLGMVALYPLGFRESQQSQDAVSGAALADAVLNPMVAALSATNITWTSWCQAIGGGTPEIGSNMPNDGWLAYCRDKDRFIPNKKESIRDSALSAIDDLLNRLDYDPGSGDKSDVKTMIRTCANDFRSQHKLFFAFVARYGTIERHDNNGSTSTIVDPSRIVLSVRTFRRSATLFSEPIYATEVHFQGDPDK